MFGPMMFGPMMFGDPERGLFSEQSDDEAPSSDLDDHIEGAPFEALMDACFAEGDHFWGAADEDDFCQDPAQTAREGSDFDFETEDEPLRCPGCGTSWDEVGETERVGCAKCYLTFQTELAQLLGEVQRDAVHVGKAPRAAQKRRRRLEQLRTRRDNQLQLLQNRLEEAVRSERYEDAAALRDKIKVVSSSLF